jgi:hypothetical protein
MKSADGGRMPMEAASCTAMDAITAPTHLLDLTMELLPLTFVGLTHADLARVARVCWALCTAVGEARCSCGQLSIEDIGQPKVRLSSSRGAAASLRGSDGSFDCAGTSQHETVLMSVARIAGTDDPWDLVPRIVFRALLSLPNLLELRLSGLVGLTDTCVSSALTPALTHLPRLSVLDLSSTAVGTRGVLSLRTLARLEELHLVYCALVSYAAVLCLRAACPRLRLIRRLPAWACGTFETPWGEEHTYWPCGAFSFRRTLQSRGFVAQLRVRQGTGMLEEYVEDRLVFVDLEPDEVALNGRIGVCLRPLGVPSIHTAPDTARGVPSIHTAPDTARGVPSSHLTPDTALYMGKAPSVLVWQDRHLPQEILGPRLGPNIPPQLASGYAVPAPGQSVQLGPFLVSTMMVRPLLDSGHAHDSAAPPAELDARLRHFCLESADPHPPVHAPGAVPISVLTRGHAESVAFWSIQGEAAILRNISDDELIVLRATKDRELKETLERRVEQCFKSAVVGDYVDDVSR